MKKEIRVIGIDDAPFDKFKDRTTEVIAPIFRGGQFIDGLLSTRVRVDGNNATEKITRMILASKYYGQIQAIFLNGIAVGGFNIIDISKLHKTTKLPVIVVMRNYPDLEKIKRALIKIKKQKKIKLLQKAGEIHNVGKVFIQFNGIPLEDAARFLKTCTNHSMIPEVLRVAHIVASGVKTGESRGQP